MIYRIYTTYGYQYNLVQKNAHDMNFVMFCVTHIVIHVRWECNWYMKPKPMARAFTLSA